MTKMNVTIVVSAVLWFGAALIAQAEDPNMKAFPPAEAGMKRFVLRLPEQAEEADFRVQLLVGQTHKLDEQNRYFLGGKIEEENIEGWGFPKFVVRQVGPLAGTLIAVDPNAPKVERFVTLGGDPFLIRYNSKLPVVVYVPAGTEVRYRVWRAEPEARTVDEG